MHGLLAAVVLGLPAAKAEGDPQRGGALYREVCMRCHASDPMIDRPGSAARVDNGVLRAIEGVAPMRWLRERLSDRDIADVQAWLEFVVLPASALRPQTGWYWDPTLPGRGFFFEYGGGYAALAAYFFAEDGRSDWSLGVARYDGSANDLFFPLDRFADGQPWSDPDWREPIQLPPLPARLKMVSSMQLTVVPEGGADLDLRRLAFDLGSAPLPVRPGMPESGWWWAPEAAGSGYAIEAQDRHLFIAAYTYAAEGRAAWRSAFGEVTADLRFESRWQVFAEGQTLLGPWQPAIERVEDGEPVTIRFLSPRSALLRFADGTEQRIERYF